MKLETKQLSYNMIKDSPEITNWLSQFKESDRGAAISLLLHLRFVTRDSYSNWVSTKINSLHFDQKCALYAVRKFPNEPKCFWDEATKVVLRPGVSLGSEDLIYSIVSNITRSNPNTFFDHPSLMVLKEQRIRNIVLLDDAIGSGKRVSGFIKSMMDKRTFGSWWSSGFIRFYIVAFARTREAEKFIIKKTPGSDHGKRKYPKSTKFSFVSEIVYGKEWLTQRWGKQYQGILDLCDSQNKVPLKWKRGYGEVMSNIVFYHSVPNSIPGILFCANNGWTPLFPGRSLPKWLCSLLDDQNIPNRHSLKRNERFQLSVSSEARQLLALIKHGIRNRSILALRMDCDIKLVEAILQNVKCAGLVSSACRLTETGRSLVIREARSKGQKGIQEFDRSLYIPKAWCANRVTVQPPVRREAPSHEQADPAKCYLAGGEVGQASLERTDAKAALPPMNVMTQLPSWPRKGHDVYGPQRGPKER